MDKYQLEFDNFFDPDNLAEWLNRPPEQVLIITCSELRTPIASVQGFIEVLLMQPIAEEIAIISNDGTSMTLREVLETMQKNTYKINRVMETVRAYNAAYAQQHPKDI